MPEAPIHETPGDRVKMLRKRASMTQTQLADMTGHTQGWISHVESSRVELDKVSVVYELAKALHCHPREILGTPGYDGAIEGHDAAAELVRSLRRLDLPPHSSEHRPLPELVQELKDLARLRGEAEYTALGARTVQVITELHAATAADGEHEREMAHRVLAHACKEVHSFAYGLNHGHLIELATSRARWNAERADDPLLHALADYMAARDAWTTADWEDAMLLVDRGTGVVARSKARPQAAASLTGALQLRGAITEARAGNGAGAYERLDEAERFAQQAQGQDPYLNWFSPGNVGLHWVAVAVELGDGAQAVARSKGLVVPKDVPHSRLAHHYMDTARGWLWINDPERALAALERADRLAPQLVRHHPMAQATMRSLLRAERRSTRERLRRMAERLHVE